MDIISLADFTTSFSVTRGRPEVFGGLTPRTQGSQRSGITPGIRHDHQQCSDRRLREGKQPGKALELPVVMQRRDLEPDMITYSSAISAGVEWHTAGQALPLVLACCRLLGSRHDHLQCRDQHRLEGIAAGQDLGAP